ncbi:hypothetical protein L3Q82_016826 [Scortum barcoo]|uniref:Uncharacterized protein n=1 Tax=Scortum barcoo TaxID=214431 RepID=A0ACB8X9B1_9TELE|nr:hypothetical protein L3Q82_016826 [Scortum barcoo]
MSPGAEFEEGLIQQLAPKDRFLTWVFLECGAPWVTQTKSQVELQAAVLATSCLAWRRSAEPDGCSCNAQPDCMSSALKWLTERERERKRRERGIEANMAAKGLVCAHVHDKTESRCLADEAGRTFKQASRSPREMAKKNE